METFAKLFASLPRVGANKQGSRWFKLAKLPVLIVGTGLESMANGRD